MEETRRLRIRDERVSRNTNDAYSEYYRVTDVEKRKLGERFVALSLDAVEERPRTGRHPSVHTYTCVRVHVRTRFRARRAVHEHTFKSHVALDVATMQHFIHDDRFH